MRAGVSLVVLGVALWAEVAAGQQTPGTTDVPVTAAKSTLTPEATTTIQVAEGRASTFKVLYTADPPLGDTVGLDQQGTGRKNAISAVLTDFRSTDGKLLATADVSRVRILAGRSLLEVSVEIDPAHDLEGGDYSGQVIVTGTAVTPARASATLKLIESPPWSERARYALAFVLLLLGVTAGAVLTWLNTKGAQLADAQRRLAAIDTRFRGLEGWLPGPFTTQLALVREALVNYDQARTTAALEQFTDEKLNQLSDLLNRFVELSRQLGSAKTAVSQRPSLPPEVLNAVLEAISETQKSLRELALGAWPPDQPVRDEAATLALAVLALVRLAEHWATPDRWSDEAATAADLFRQRRWADATTAVGQLSQPPAAQLAARAAASGGVDAARAQRGPLFDWLTGHHDAPGDDVPGARRRWYHFLRGWRIFLLRRFNFLAGCLVALGVVVAGLSEVFDPETTFTDVGDSILKLVGWGFGVQTVGVTLAQLGNTLIGDRVKFSGA